MGGQGLDMVTRVQIDNKCPETRVVTKSRVGGLCTWCDQGLDRVTRVRIDNLLHEFKYMCKKVKHTSKSRVGYQALDRVTRVIVEGL